MTESIPTCCCRRRDCLAFLTHHQEIDQLEQKNALAGQLGQALLLRHETYVADAEQERRRMMEKIGTLERDKTELEQENKRTIQENRDLIDQLEALNGAVKDSETKVQSLTEVLQSTEHELERINGLASRTERLHDQLERLEDDLSVANSLVATTKDEQRAATLRWQQAERTITSLNGQIDQIEREAKAERDRHTEILSRVKRRKAVEVELLAGRHPKSPAQDPNVVSHFVKDILQDNANLQLGIMELRDMLHESNDEVERLRDLVILPPNCDLPEQPGSQTPTLGVELGGRALHVHHHYHAPIKPDGDTKTQRAQAYRRPRRKRGGLSSGSHTPRSSISVARPTTPTSASAILSQTSVTIPKRGSNRWSMQSSQTGFTSSSSLPSSPYNDSIFDRVFGDTTTDASRPSSPDSVGAFSPRNGDSFGLYEARAHSRSNSLTKPSLDNPQRSASEAGSRYSHSSIVSTRSMSSSRAPARESIHQDHDLLPTTHSTILEENEDLESSQRFSPVAQRNVIHAASPIRQAPPLRRSTSHESLISISGMDIHTLHSRPSQLLLGKYASTPTSSSSAVAITDTSALATRPELKSVEARSISQTYLSGIAAAQRPRTLNRKESKSSLLAGRVGGWVWSKWGTTPAETMTTSGDAASSTSAISARSVSASASLATTTAAQPSLDEDTASLTSGSQSIRSTSTLDHPSAIRTPRSASASKTTDLSFSPRKIVMRPPGVNQSGPIFGFAPEKKLDKTVVVRGLDVEALRDGLGDTD